MIFFHKKTPRYDKALKRGLAAIVSILFEYQIRFY